MIRLEPAQHVATEVYLQLTRAQRNSLAAMALLVLSHGVNDPAGAHLAALSMPILGEDLFCELLGIE